MPPPFAPRPCTRRKNVPRVKLATCASSPLMVVLAKITPACVAGVANLARRLDPPVEEASVPSKSHCATADQAIPLDAIHAERERTIVRVFIVAIAQFRCSRERRQVPHHTAEVKPF